tara:strand:- start:893 stop:1135 length:243 start_codon:yes stop_codon:yes gene_type:complete
MSDIFENSKFNDPYDRLDFIEYVLETNCKTIEQLANLGNQYSGKSRDAVKDIAFLSDQLLKMRIRIAELEKRIQYLEALN